MIYRCYEALFVPPGLPVAPAKVSAALGGGTDRHQGEEGLEARTVPVGTRQEQSRAHPMQWAHPEHPSSVCARYPAAAGDIHLSPLLHPEGLRGRCKQPLQELSFTGRMKTPFGDSSCQSQCWEPLPTGVTDPAAITA